ncbi:MAG TPA: Na+:solute symporter, partial [Blastocatellia bacterium]|nr:Na+:solute symporter [Blastocatellia bacterium]
LVSVAFLAIKKSGGHVPSTAGTLLITIGVTTVCWVLAAYLAPQTDRQTLIEFYSKIRPAGPGWEPIREEAGISKAEAAKTGESIPLALVGWAAGCAAIWSALFTVGNVLYGRTSTAFLMGVVFVVSGLVLLRVINKLWK